MNIDSILSTLNLAVVLPTHLDPLKMIGRASPISARVLAVESGIAVLRSTLGDITAQNSLGLVQNDRVLIRVIQRDGQPVLKVSPQNSQYRESAPLQVKTYPAIKTVMQLGNNLVQFKRLPEGDLILTKNQNILIPRQLHIKAGQLLQIKPSADAREFTIKAVSRIDFLKTQISEKIIKLNKMVASNPRIDLKVLLKQAASIILKPTDTLITNQTSVDQKVLSTTPAVEPAIKVLIAKVQSELGILFPASNQAGKTLIQHWVENITQPLNLQTIPIWQLLKELTGDKNINSKIDAMIKSSDIETNLTTNQLRQFLIEIARTLEQVDLQQLIQKFKLQLQHEFQQPHSFELALPLQDNKDTQLLKLFFNQNNNTDTEEETSGWKVRIDIELPTFGKLTSQISLTGTRLSINFWTEHRSGQVILENSIEILRNNLKCQGFSLEICQCFQGIPPLPQPDFGLPKTETLVDIRV
jgi:hypothetical protein